MRKPLYALVNATSISVVVVVRDQEHGDGHGDAHHDGHAGGHVEVGHDVPGDEVGVGDDLVDAVGVDLLVRPRVVPVPEHVVHADPEGRRRQELKLDGEQLIPINKITNMDFLT